MTYNGNSKSRDMDEIKNKVYELEGLLELLALRPEKEPELRPLVGKRIKEIYGLWTVEESGNMDEIIGTASEPERDDNDDELYVQDEYEEDDYPEDAGNDEDYPEDIEEEEIEEIIPPVKNNVPETPVSSPEVPSNTVRTINDLYKR